MCRHELHNRCTAGNVPAPGGSTGADVATTPKLENALKELGNATEHALTPCSGSRVQTQLIQ
jgi:hypothetical protein